MWLHFTTRGRGTPTPIPDFDMTQWADFKCVSSLGGLESMWLNPRQLLTPLPMARYSAPTKGHFYCRGCKICRFWPRPGGIPGGRFGESKLYTGGWVLVNVDQKQMPAHKPLPPLPCHAADAGRWQHPYWRTSVHRDPPALCPLRPRPVCSATTGVFWWFVCAVDITFSTVRCPSLLGGGGGGGATHADL